MTHRINTKDRETLAAAMYFTVGRGTEGGTASYRLSVAGVNDSSWGSVSAVAANSGYSLGAIQVDFGQRGTWPLGAVEGRALRQGEKTYVDAVIEQSSAYAKRHQLPFTDDLEQLREDLLSHGNGKGKRSSITFIDVDTRNSINAWGSSPEGKRWIHSHIDYPQVINMTQIAMSILDRNRHSVSEDRRFEAANILAKTANQAPARLPQLENVLKNGGGYDELLTEARAIQARLSYYHGTKAASVAHAYESRYGIPSNQQAMDRAHIKVGMSSYDPSNEALDADIQVALSAIGQGRRGRMAADPTIASIQQNLNTLGITDARGEPLTVDGLRGGPGSRTNEAVAAFQRQSLPGDLAGQQTPAGLLAATEAALDARDPMRRLNHPVDGIGQRMGTGAGIQPQATASQSHTGLPDFLVQTRHAEASATTAVAASTPPQAGRALPTQGREAPAASEAATVALPALPQSDLQPGDRGRSVVALQQHLRILGATDRDGRPLQADGHYGQRTQDAVEQFQLWSGCGAKGIADKDTLQALAVQSRFAALQREQGIGAGRRLADNLAPSDPAPADAAELRYSPVVASANTRSDPSFWSFSQPEHPQNALYSQLKSALPEYTSEQRLAQFTAALHVDGIRPGDLKAIDVSAERAQFTTRWGAITSVDLAAHRPPSTEESLQKVESHNQELQEQAAQRAQNERQQQAQAVQH